MVDESNKTTLKQGPVSHRHAVRIETQSRVEFKEITDLVQNLISQSGIQSGTCLLFVPHTTAAILINESYDPSLQKDFDTFLGQLAPRDRDYYHNDGNCDAHLKAALIGNSKSLMIENGHLVLGTWQGVFFCEFDGPRHRDLRVKIVAD